MPVTPLFSLDGIDFGSVAVDADAVGRINPQAGAMRQLDHVVWMSDDLERIVGLKRVTDEEFWVPLHIPGNPLMPGVLMIEAAAQLMSVLYHHKVEEAGFVGFTRCDETVFRDQVVPGDELQLLVKQVQFRPRRLICRGQGLVNGRIAFETTITGMVVVR